MAVSPTTKSDRQTTTSSRRGAARSDRRTAIAVARPLTEEEIAARRARLKLILIVLGISAAGILLLVGMFFLLKEDPRYTKALGALREAESLRNAAGQALDGRNPAIARKAIDDALAALKIPELDFANDPPDLESRQLASPQLAILAAAVVKTLSNDLEPRLKRVDREIRAETNHRDLDAAFGRLSETSLNLADLETKAQAFIANPVQPDEGPNETYAKDHARFVERIRLRLPDLEREKKRREAQVTSDPIRIAEVEIQNLIRSERFADAKTRITRLRKDFPKTDEQAGALERRVDEAAKKTWVGVEQYVQTRLDDIQAAGTPTSRRTLAAQEARDRLDQVIANFGLDDYLNKARSLRDRLPAPP